MVDSSPAVVNGVVYVGTSGHRVVAYKAATRRRCRRERHHRQGTVGRITAQPPGLLLPAVANGVLYTDTARR